MNCQVLCVVISGLLLQAAFASPVVDDVKDHHINSVHSEKSTIEESLFKKLNVKCSNQDISSCMMLKLVNYFNRLLKKSYIDLGDVEISQTSTEPVNVESSRSLNEVENIPEEEQLYEVLINKALNFVKTRSLKWKVLDVGDLVVAGSSDKDGSLNIGLSLKPNSVGIEEGRKKKGKGGSGIYAILAAGAMKIALLKALAFKALVLLVGKALLVSKLALVLASVIGLKKLLSGGEKHVTYEVVAQPHHEHHIEHSHSGGGLDAHGSGGWGRTFDAHAAQHLAYNAHVPSN